MCHPGSKTELGGGAAGFWTGLQGLGETPSQRYGMSSWASARRLGRPNGRGSLKATVALLPHPLSADPFPPSTPRVIEDFPEG